MIEYIDIHCHLNFPDFDHDREAIIAEVKERKIGAIVVGTTLETSKKAVEIAQRHENIWAIVGCHPVHAEEGFDYDAYKTLAQDKRVVGIGECGLDYKYPNKKQREVFEQQIALAQELDKPLMLHIRDAYKDAYDMIKSKSVRGNAHFFAGSVKDAKNFLDIGFYLSFTGVVTFTHDYDQVIKMVPSDRIMSETDSPYVAPVPNRGKRNTPLNVVDVVAKLADIRGESLIHSKSTVLDNARKIFRNISYPIL